MTTHADDHTPTHVRDALGNAKHAHENTWREHRNSAKKWGLIIGTAHAHHDLYHEIVDMSMKACSHIVESHIGGTLLWEADMPNPIEAWQEVYGEEMPDDFVLQAQVRLWARAYHKAYEDEVYRLVCERQNKYYRENPITWVRGH